MAETTVGLEVVHDGWPDRRWEPEPCCICWTPTHYWYEPKDVALCQTCARTASPSDVPTKNAWCDAVRERMGPRD